MLTFITLLLAVILYLLVGVLTALHQDFEADPKAYGKAPSLRDYLIRVITWPKILLSSL